MMKEIRGVTYELVKTNTYECEGCDLVDLDSVLCHLAGPACIHGVTDETGTYSVVWKKVDESDLEGGSK